MSTIITRRGFLAGMLALGAAPAIVKANSLMKIVVPKREIIIPTGFAGLGADFDGDTFSFSKAYHMQAARQDEFGETFFPTIVIKPDQILIAPHLPKMFVHSPRGPVKLILPKIQQVHQS